VPLHGHTPGHSGYMISSGNQSLLIWGDIVHVPDIQIPRPEVTIEFDTDPHAAAATRKRVLDMVTTDRLLVAGMHMHFPGFAHVVKRGEDYMMLPEPWDQAF
jgi:glyoxylase-like metal-dependent hydrolase (beta-lactamase superfamily II)